MTRQLSKHPLSPSLFFLRPLNEEKLTALEVQTMALVAQGLTNRKIGLLVGLHPMTVSKRLRKIFRKLGTTNRINAVVQFIISHQPKSLGRGRAPFHTSR